MVSYFLLFWTVDGGGGRRRRRALLVERAGGAADVRRAQVRGGLDALGARRRGGGNTRRERAASPFGSVTPLTVALTSPGVSEHRGVEPERAVSRHGGEPGGEEEFRPPVRRADLELRLRRDRSRWVRRASLGRRGSGVVAVSR